jgi:hypothetical protein
MHYSFLEIIEFLSIIQLKFPSIHNLVDHRFMYIIKENKIYFRDTDDIFHDSSTISNLNTDIDAVLLAGFQTLIHTIFSEFLCVLGYVHFYRMEKFYKVQN